MFTMHHGFSQVSFPHLFHNYKFYGLQSQSNFQIPRIDFENNRVRAINFGPVTWKNIPIEIKLFEMLTHLKQESQTGNRQTVDVDYVKRM